MHRIAIIAAAALTCTAAQAGDLIYQPVSPSFGGSALNGSFLMNGANAQNPFDDRTFTPIDPLDQFADSIQRRVLSQASREITDRIFGENAQDSGQFSVGNSQVLFEQIGDQIQLTLTDTNTGAQTNLTIPAPQF